MLVRAENAMRMGAVRMIDVAFVAVTWSGWPGGVARPLLRVALLLVTLGGWILSGLQEEE